MPVLTRRRDPNRADCWRIHYGDVHVGGVAQQVGNPGAAEVWLWSCGCYPGSNPGDQRSGTASSFEATRAAFESAWRDYLPKPTEADFQAWHDHEARTADKYRRFDSGERMPLDWRGREG